METHWHYQVYGQRLCSSRPLRELPRFSFESRDVAFRYLPPGEALDIPWQDCRLLTRRPTTLECDLSLYWTGAGFLLRWEGQCDFLVSEDGRYIQCQPSSDTQVMWTEGTLYNMILSFALFLRGVSNFHASAVALPDGAVGFMADPGSGKSSLAAGFTGAGFPFLTDDVLAVQEDSGAFLGYPGYPHVSLSCHSLDGLFGSISRPPVEFSNGEKERIALADLGASFSSQPVPLKALFILRRASDGRAICLERLPRIAAVQGLLEHTNCLPLLPREVLQPHLNFIERLTAAVPVYYLHYPSGLENVPRVIGAITQEVRWLPDPAELAEYPVGTGKASQP